MPRSLLSDQVPHLWMRGSLEGDAWIFVSHSVRDHKALFHNGLRHRTWIVGGARREILQACARRCGTKDLCHPVRGKRPARLWRATRRQRRRRSVPRWLDERRLSRRGLTR